MIKDFSNDYAFRVRSLVLGVLEEEGFAYDPLKDSDLEDIQASYLGKGGSFFIALVDDELAGTAGVRKAGHDICEIRRIYVRRSMRGQGIGSALFGTALCYAKTNYSRALLKTDVSLHTAIGMYLRHGFKVVKEQDGTLYLEKMLC
jgi:putative acetyltransferase